MAEMGREGGGGAASERENEGGEGKIWRGEWDLYGNILYFCGKICINGFKARK